MAQLRQKEAELKRLDTAVLLVSFGAPDQARSWRVDTQAPFPLALDPERRVYDAYGLGRSIARVWSPRVMVDYTRRVLAGQRLKGIQGDPHQLGGDFIIDRQGVLRLAWPSRDPLDRPAVETLLNALRHLPR